MVEKNLVNLKELTFQEQDAVIKKMGEPPFRARQLRKWLYQKNCCDIGAMTDFSKALREKLSREFTAEGLITADKAVSGDGTVKYLFELSDGLTVETVLIPDEKRNTVCVSTQVGCKFGCLFCATGQQGFVRDLTAGEIANQVIESQTDLTARQAGKVTNVVFMGMGEPLDNFGALADVLRLFTSSEGFGLGKRRITVSTAGVVPGIEKLGDLGLGVNLAISLHSASDATRSLLMPINKKYPVKALMKSCAEFPLQPQRSITMEVILFDGVNDSAVDAKILVTALRGVKAKVNLLRFNPVSHCGYTASPMGKVESFMARLLAARIPVTLRQSRGADIMAACGQLKSGHVEKTG